MPAVEFNFVKGRVYDVSTKSDRDLRHYTRNVPGAAVFRDGCDGWKGPAGSCLRAKFRNQSPSRVDDATLKRAAAAYVKVRDISVKAEQEINSTDDTAKKQQLADESESEKVAAVKAQGMEPQQYNNVIMLVKDDSGLQQKFLSYVQQLRRSS